MRDSVQSTQLRLIWTTRSAQHYKRAVRPSCATCLKLLATVLRTLAFTHQMSKSWDWQEGGDFKNPVRTKLHIKDRSQLLALNGKVHDGWTHKGSICKHTNTSVTLERHVPGLRMFWNRISCRPLFNLRSLSATV